MNTTEKNKLLAKVLEYNVLEGVKLISVIHNNQLKVFNPDKDWNLLMEVVEKIESLNYSFNIFMKAVSIHKKDGEAIVDLNGNNYNSKRNAVYNACIKFAKYYNKLKK